MSKLERTTFESSRAAEYFDVRELQAQTGQPLSNFATVALKELLDNALDAAETAGVAPKVGVEAHEDGELLRITVSDNGLGIPPEVVRKVLNFNTRTSDKAAYRSPTRGAQGNALKTVIGIPHALGCKEPVVIEGRGVRHSIHAWIDPAGELRVDRDETDIGGQPGTRVGLALPAEDQVFTPRYWALAFALFNPHATVKIRTNWPLGGRSEQAKSGEHEMAKIYHSTVPFLGQGFRKFLPTDLTSPHWYSTAALKRLVFSHIADARNGGRDLPLREFVRQFRGLSGTKKAKAVVDDFPGIKHLSDVEEKPEAAAALLVRMREETKPPSHEVLGYVGEEHFRKLFEKTYEVKEFSYKRVKAEFPSGFPYVFEFALALTREPGHLFTGINFSPTYGDPLAGTLLLGPKFSALGIRGFLSEGHASPEPRTWLPSPSPTAAAAHIVTPAPVFLDRGKTRLQMEESDEEA